MGHFGWDEKEFHSFPCPILLDVLITVGAISIPQKALLSAVLLLGQPGKAVLMMTLIGPS
jgi:hypothetical protein